MADHISYNDNARENPSINAFDALIEYLEDITTVKFPDNLKSLLKHTGFDNLISLSELTDSDIDNMNKFASEVLPQLLDESEIKCFFGIFAKKPNLFKISDGHRKLLTRLAKEAADRLISRKRTRLGTRQQPNDNSNDKSKKVKLYNKFKRSTTSSATKSQENQFEEIVDERTSIDNEDVKNHIKEVALNYLKKFCQELPQEQSERTLKGAESIIITTDGTSAAITCFLCKFQSRIYAQKTRYGTTWVLSNFNKHVKTHFKNNNSEIRKPGKKVQNTSILSYYSVSNNLGNAEKNSSNLENNMLNAVVEVSDSQKSSETSLEAIEQCGETSKNRPNSVFGFDDLDFSASRVVKGTNNSALDLIDLSPKTHKRSRLERAHNRLSIVAHNKNQAKITDFYSIVQNIETHLKQNLETNTMFKTYLKDNLNIKVSSENECLDSFLGVLKNHALENSKKSKYGNRFCEPLKLFSLYIFITGGRLLYETLKSNMPNALPSISTLHRSIDNTKNVLEGIVRFEELKEYLIKREYPLRLFVSEDQTSVIKRIQYDSKSNRMIGFVLPLSKTSGFTLKDCFFANSVIMAQPLIQNAPAFCLALFGSDNKFTSQDVLNRWSYLKEQATLHGIQIDGFASDGDTRCLKAMMMNSKLPIMSQQPNCPYNPYFQMEYNIEKPTCIQDPIHIGTKN